MNNERHVINLKRSEPIVQNFPPPQSIPVRKRTIKVSRLRLARKQWYLIGGVAALLIALFVMYRFSSSSPTLTSTMTQAQIIERVGTLMLLPDETPTIAVVSDLKPLQSQAFFKGAEIGDIVLMYPKTARAILYDPRQNKIIEVGPIVVTR
jgi:hypothetical protein